MDTTTPPAIPPVVKRSATDRIREKLLAAKPRETFVEFEDEQYLLVAPSVRRAGAIMRAAVTLPKGKNADDIKPEDVKVDDSEIKVQALIECLRDNDTKAPVLAQSDHDALMDGPLTPMFNALGTAAAELLRPKNAKKNSDTITPG
jgi:hypothetical protein